MISMALAVLATMLGTYGPLLHVESGPLTITIAAGFFLQSLMLRRAT